MAAPDKIWAAARKHTGWKYAGCTDAPSSDCEPYHHQRTVDELLEALEAIAAMETQSANATARKMASTARALIAKHRKGG